MERIRQQMDDYEFEEAECLKKVAGGLDAARTRAIDLVARYGGEEFVAVLPDTDGEGVVLFGERLRQNIINLNIPHQYSKIAEHVTISLGAVTLIPDQSHRLEDFIPTADQKLYQAKEKGRNRLIF